jgi:hypothetical protein
MFRTGESRMAQDFIMLFRAVPKLKHELLICGISHLIALVCGQPKLYKVKTKLWIREML